MTFTAKDRSLSFVADGVGGHYAGEMASEIVMSALCRWWEEKGLITQRAELFAIVEELRSLIAQCNVQVRLRTPTGHRCGTTIVVLWISGHEYAVLSVGDSRCYQTRSEGIWQKTCQITVDDVIREDCPGRGKLLRAVGAEETCFVSVRSGRLEKTTLFTLCSDGIYRFCDEQKMSAILKRENRTGLLHHAAQEIEQEVLQRNAPDNYSLILTRVLPDGKY